MAETNLEITAATTDQPSGSNHHATDNQTSDSGVGERPMDRQLLKACTTGDLNLFKHLILRDPEDALFSVTPQGNNCLHIAAMLGHQQFAERVWATYPFLFSATNKDGETPLMAAIMAANAALAADMLSAALQLMQPDLEGGTKPLNDMLLKFDERGDNALHHTLRNGFEDLAVRLLDIEPRLSEQANKIGESPMHMAARRGYSSVVKKLLQIPSSVFYGPGKYSALHAAVDSGHTGRPELAYHVAEDGRTPLVVAIFVNNPEIVKILLEHDPNLAYFKNEATGFTPLHDAACHGSVPIVELIISACPDSAYTTTKEYSENALHLAIGHEKIELVDVILRTPQLHRLINQVDNRGDLPLHYAARMCNPKILRSLLSHNGQDYTASNLKNANGVDLVSTWEDLDYLLNYRKTTRALMWCAYAATAVSFGTGLFTVMAHKSLWLAILILVLSCIPPFISKIIGDWPKIMVRLRVGRQFRSDLVPNI
ncbi:Ankyrin repeat family protein [Rhynchospora pubera]|uniref:Ankyrin repeat family protein n=1 Tax=Rhynchospora pubera TaxID=906938 RepID=A0AAV8HK55_9POAL|nr:Ankyrin repeat family protein [Rhynchospora pubera]